MKDYILLFIISFFVAFCQHSFFAELLGKYLPDLSLVVLFVVLLSFKSMKERNFSLSCFFAFCLGLFSALFLGSSLGALSLYYVMLAYILAFFIQRTSHTLLLFIIIIFLARFVFLLLMSYIKSLELTYTVFALNALLTTFVFYFAVILSNIYRRRIFYDK